MKELVINQPSKNIMLMIQKMVGRKQHELDILSGCYDYDLQEKVRDIEDELYYEFFQKGTYTCCILTIDDSIVGIGMTKRDRRDKYNARVAGDVAAHKAVEDYLFGVKGEWTHVEME